MSNCIFSAKVMIFRLIAGQIRKILLYKISNYPETDSNSRNKMKAGFYLSNHATKSQVKKKL